MAITRSQVLHFSFHWPFKVTKHIRIYMYLLHNDWLARRFIEVNVYGPEQTLVKGKWVENQKKRQQIKTHVSLACYHRITRLLQGQWITMKMYKEPRCSCLRLETSTTSNSLVCYIHMITGCTQLSWQKKKKKRLHVEWMRYGANLSNNNIQNSIQLNYSINIEILRIGNLCVLRIFLHTITYHKLQ